MTATFTEETAYNIRKTGASDKFVTVGVVVDVNDPDQQGRLRVRCPYFSEDADLPVGSLPWCLVASPSGGQSGGRAHGMMNAFEIDAEVLVLCLEGNIEHRVVIGALPPPYMTNTVPHGRNMIIEGQGPYGPYNAYGEPIQPGFDNAQEAWRKGGGVSGDPCGVSGPVQIPCGSSVPSGTYTGTAGGQGGQARSLRNNNPGNIKGTGPAGSDGVFKKYNSMQEGWAGMEWQLNRYYTGKTTGTPLRSVNQIISTWAPTSENNTSSYVTTVSKKMNVDPNQPLDWNNLGVRRDLMEAMATHETGEQMSMGDASQPNEDCEEKAAATETASTETTTEAASGGETPEAAAANSRSTTTTTTSSEESGDNGTSISNAVSPARQTTELKPLGDTGTLDYNKTSLQNGAPTVPSESIQAVSRWPGSVGSVGSMTPDMINSLHIPEKFKGVIADEDSSGGKAFKDLKLPNGSMFQLGQIGYGPDTNHPNVSNDATGGTSLSQKISFWESPGMHSMYMNDSDWMKRMHMISSAGHQILMDDTNERIYISTAKGGVWLELDQTGSIDIFGAREVSLSSDGDINLFAKKNIRMSAMKGIQMTAEEDIRMHAKGEVHVKANNAAHIESVNDLNLRSGASVLATADGVIGFKGNGGGYIQTGCAMHLKSDGPVYVTGSEAHINSTPAGDAPEATWASEGMTPSRIPEKEPYVRGNSSAAEGDSDGKLGDNASTGDVGNDGGGGEDIGGASVRDIGGLVGTVTESLSKVQSAVDTVNGIMQFTGNINEVGSKLNETMKALKDSLDGRTHTEDGNSYVADPKSMNDKLLDGAKIIRGKYFLP